MDNLSFSGWGYVTEVMEVTLGWVMRSRDFGVGHEVT